MLQTHPAPDAPTIVENAPRAVVFPGQGSQRPGMAAPWKSTAGFSRWAEADEVLGWDVSRLGTAADADELRRPLACQVALYVHGAVLWQAWLDAGGTAAIAAGHSLGEYNALLAAGVIAFADGLRLVEQRALATQAAAELSPGGMVACLGGDADAVRAACTAAGAEVANDNADGQLVVAGDDAALQRFTDAAAAARAKVIRLEVGAAYHSSAMTPALPAFSAAVAATRFRDSQVGVVSNVDATVHHRGADWPDLLRAQLTTPVRWRETMLGIDAAGMAELVELAASPVLTGLAKRTAPGVRRRTVTTPDDLAAA